MGNVKKRFLKVDYINTDKVRGEITQIQQYTSPYNLGDFTSDDDIPNIRAVRAIAGGLVGSYEVSVTGSNLVIDWQNDLIDGVKTYAQALGDNLPTPTHYFYDGVDTYTRGGVEPVVVRTAGIIDTVTFDWGYSTDCVIVF